MASKKRFSKRQGKDDAAIAQAPENLVKLYGQVVWARMKGFPAWPAYVYDPRHLGGSRKRAALRKIKTEVPVFFYYENESIKSFAELGADRIFPWNEENLARFQNGEGKKIPSKMKLDLEGAIRTAEKEFSREEDERVMWMHDVCSSDEDNEDEDSHRHAAPTDAVVKSDASAADGGGDDRGCEGDKPSGGGNELSAGKRKRGPKNNAQSIKRSKPNSVSSNKNDAPRSRSKSHDGVKHNSDVDSCSSSSSNSSENSDGDSGSSDDGSSSAESEADGVNSGSSDGEFDGRNKTARSQSRRRSKGQSKVLAQKKPRSRVAASGGEAVRRSSQNKRLGGKDSRDDSGQQMAALSRSGAGGAVPAPRAPAASALSSSLTGPGARAGGDAGSGAEPRENRVARLIGMLAAATAATPVDAAAAIRTIEKMGSLSLPSDSPGAAQAFLAASGLARAVAALKKNDDDRIGKAARGVIKYWKRVLEGQASGPSSTVTPPVPSVLLYAPVLTTPQPLQSSSSSGGVSATKPLAPTQTGSAASESERQIGSIAQGPGSSLPLAPTPTVLNTAGRPPLPPLPSSLRQAVRESGRRSLACALRWRGEGGYRSGSPMPHCSGISSAGNAAMAAVASEFAGLSEEALAARLETEVFAALACVSRQSPPTKNASIAVPTAGSATSERVDEESLDWFVVSYGGLLRAAIIEIARL